MLDNRIQLKLLEFAQQIKALDVLSDMKEYSTRVSYLVKVYAEEIQDIDKELPAELENERWTE